MMTRPIPSTGEAMPVIGLGTWRAFDVGSDETGRRPLRQVLQRLLDDGGRIIDTSPMYGQAEAVTGDLLAESGARPRSFLATKVWTTGRERGIEQMRRSAQLLRTAVIDLMQIHNLVDWRTHLATLRRMKEEGRVRYIGITHYTTGALPELARILRAEPGIDFVQLGYSLATPAAETELLPIGRRARRCGHCQPAIGARRSVPPRSPACITRLGAPIRLCKLGGAVPQIRAGRARGNLRDPGNRQSRPHEGQSRRRIWQSPRRAAAQADPRIMGRALDPLPGCHRERSEAISGRYALVRWRLLRRAKRSSQ